MAAGDLGQIDAGVALEVPADQQDWPEEWDDGPRAPGQWDELE
jgi:hypothetical protein